MLSTSTPVKDKQMNINTNTEIKKYDYIDAIRGIAILGVMLVHCSQSVSSESPVFQKIALGGAMGVQLFFIASALTLCMSWAYRSLQDANPITYFYTRRIFRIAPLFYVGIISYLFINGFAPSYWAPNGIKWSFIPLTALFIHGFHPETISSVVPGGWSIAVEMTFYLIMPFLVPRIKSIKACVAIFFLAMVLLKINQFVVPLFFNYPENQKYLVRNFSHFNFLGQFPVFIIGILTYLVIKNKYKNTLLVLYSAVILFTFSLRNIFGFMFLPSYILASFYFSIFTVLLSRFPIKILVNSVTKILGKLSFSMYITHFAVLTYFSRFGISDLFPSTDLSSLLYFFLITICTVAVSIFTYNFVEKPGINLGNQCISWIQRFKKKNQIKSINIILMLLAQKLKL
jgi:peptidoglycan/LPS O-acetylase OafA/YrhL